MNAIEKFDTSMGQFHLALIERFSRMVEMGGNRMVADLVETPYVIPGVLYEIRYHGGTDVYKFWIGANFTRLFFITRAVITPEKAKESFQFTFGGAEHVGWKINYEQIGDNEVSIWATINTHELLIRREPAQSGNEGQANEEKVTLTDTGAFFAVDIPMMVQSYIRTSQRLKIEPSKEDPAPL